MCLDLSLRLLLNFLVTENCGSDFSLRAPLTDSKH